MKKIHIKKFMKSIFIIMGICCFSPLYSQISIGGYTMFPDRKIWGMAWKPRLAILKIDSYYYLSLEVTQPDNYALFSEDSRLLIKFSDTITYKCPFLPKIGVTKDYDIDFSRRKTEYYHTYTTYDLSDEMLARIRNGEYITKIRIVFDNGDIKDYDIGSSYQKTFIKELQESLEECTISNDIRRSNMDDSNF